MTPTYPIACWGFVVCGLSLLSACAAAGPTTQPATGASPGPWKLVWSDEFDYTGLPDSTKWGYEEGFVRNNELQFYTRGRLENARVENGLLIIEARKEEFPIPARKGATKTRFAHYTAASLITQHKAAWTFGRIEVRAKIPQGLGVWPAIWMLGEKYPNHPWPLCGEIDIMEFVGHTPDKIHGTLHFGKNGKHASIGSFIVTQKPFDDFHIYAIEWRPDRIDFFFDSQKHKSILLTECGPQGEESFHKPQYLLLNFALGGSWGQKIDDAILPQKFQIDYVRVFQTNP